MKMPNLKTGIDILGRSESCRIFGYKAYLTETGSTVKAVMSMAKNVFS